MKFKIGDKVKITKSSQFYRNDDKYNPINEIGTIKRYSDSTYPDALNIGVSWEDNTSNSYNGKDLELVVENMNQEIEEGDYITGCTYKEPREVLKVTSAGYYQSSGFTDKKDAKLVSKANKQEIVGYELLKDLPGIPAGTKTQIGSISQDGSALLLADKYSSRYTKDLLQDTTWFKPIYKAKKVVVKISSNREVCITDNRIDLLNKEGEHMNFNQFRTLTDRVLSSKLNIGISAYDFEILTFRIGCQEFTKADLQEITKATQNLK